jgi:peptidoglycan/LPS O-acetylase OafA/YrhL
MQYKVKFLIPYLLLIVLVCCAYSNTLQSPPVLDDFHSFVRNPTTHVEEWNKTAVSHLAHTHFGLARFIPMLTFAFDYWCGDGNLMNFHISNICIHILCWVSVLFFLVSLTKTPVLGEQRLQRSPLWAMAIASIWALHPIQTSAVTYLVQRMTSIQAMFFVGATGAYLKARLNQRAGVRGIACLWAGACVLFGLGALFSKENSYMLPFVWLCVEMWFINPNVLDEIHKKAIKKYNKIKLAIFLGVISIFIFLIINILIGYLNP